MSNKFSHLFFLLILSFSLQSEAQNIVDDSNILETKRLLDLSQQKLSVVREADTEFSSANVQFKQRQLIEAQLTLLENKNQLIPFQGLDTLRIAALSVGSGAVTPFQKMLNNYTKVDYFNLSSNFTAVETNAVLQKLAGYNLVITGIHSLPDEKSLTANKNEAAASGQTENIEKLLGHLSPVNHSVVVLFLDPKAVNELNELGNPEGLLVAYQNTTNTQNLAAQLIFGGIGAKGKLPVSFGQKYKAGDGLDIGQLVRLKYTLPEEVGLNSVMLNHRIDSIVNNALEKRAFPGCNVLVAKDGKIIFQKAYGFHTYENRTPASLDDIYDLASVTKVSGALPAIMKLNEEGKYLLDEKFSTYWSDWRKGFLHPSNKSNLTVRELLTHQAGLVPYMPFWKQSVTEKGLSHKWYNVEQNDQFDLQVAPGLYLDSKFKNKVYKSIRKSPLDTRGQYVYSCLSFIIAPEVISKLAGMKFTDYLDQNFYRPLGATTVTYLPSQKFSDDQIVPTEYDSIFRKQLVHSSVHDEASAVLGGISGNAGLFASANDLAKLVQMYVQFGTYGGKQYLKRATLEEFTRIQYPQNNNRRGLGFDKPLIGNQKMDKAHAYPCPGASPQSFGHSGVTGTFFWADPANGLIYIFLSNRVYPTRENNKISDLNVRTDILQELYDELNKLH
ncbi:MAG: serine hydrolase [Mariniphaga sp.]